ncbi:substrate-binding domain-containing protein [Streptomyces sp. 4N509B]|uniref:substrate-binding domain-containing protein n=1 Tax=Streptomyces sp. 4N509B TaxID=3457413 RepID=UPI003FD3C1C2
MAERGPATSRAPRRPTVGLVTANIHLGVGATLWAGVLEAAERNDVDLVCFPGDPLRPGGAPRNGLYDLIDADLAAIPTAAPAAGPMAAPAAGSTAALTAVPTTGLDGRAGPGAAGGGWPRRLDGAICWTSTLGPEAEAERLLARLAGLPVVSLNRTLGDHPDHETLLLDSYSGMRKAVSHLVRAHGRRRLACLRGPLANPVSVNRYRAYADALAHHHIHHDRSLVAASVDFANGAGASAMRVLVDVRGLRPGTDFDAVVACSDVLAADALRFLAGRGVRVPEDVAVISFNDSQEARLADPPLTSVALPFAELGALAVETLLARLRGEPPPTRRAVPGTLVTRRSCGCHSPLVTQGEPDGGDDEGGGTGTRTGSRTGADAGAEDAAGAAGADASAAVGDGVAGVAGGTGRWSVRLPEASDALLDALRADLAAGHGVAFLGLLERHLDGWIHTAEDAAAWDRALLRLRAAGNGDARAERLLGQARLLVADKARRLLEYERWAREQEARRLRELGTALTTAVDTDAIRAALDRHLPGLGVAGYRLVLGDGLTGERGGRSGQGDGPTGERDARGGREAGGRGGDMNGRDRHGGDEAPAARRTTVLEPLHIGDERLGHVVFDAGPRERAARQGALYRALGDQISAALKGVRLFTEVRSARDAAERASQFKTRLLDNATDELRTPVEAILRSTRDRDPATAEEAGRLLRLIDDLLDLTRSEIDALDLSLRLLDPRPLLAGTFAAQARPGWRLRLPPRLPALRADAARLRQITGGLLTAATGPATALAADADADRLHVRVTSPDLVIPAGPPGEEERFFQPFASGERGSRLVLAIARRLAVLHGGSVTLLRDPAPGFHLELPLPTPAEPAGGPPAPQALASGRGTVLLAAGGHTPEEVNALAIRHGLTVRHLHPDDDVATLTSGAGPAAVVWQTERATPQEWATLRRLHDHPALRHTPFLLYGPVPGEEPRDLGQALHASRPSGLAEPAVIADGSAASRERLRALLTGVLPGRPVRAAADGTAACALFEEEDPGLLIVDRALADMDGFELVERLSEATGQPGVGSVPVLMLSASGFTEQDARRAERHPALVLLGRDVLTDEETARLLTRMLERARTDPVAQRGHAPVRHALAYLEQHYRHRFSRWQVAQVAGVSEDHLGRLFHRELGVTLWEYLTRLRIRRAKERLQRSDDSVQAVARAVGFHDRAYFSRVFRKVTGIAPHAFRDAS